MRYDRIAIIGEGKLATRVIDSELRYGPFKGRLTATARVGCHLRLTGNVEPPPGAGEVYYRLVAYDHVASQLIKCGKGNYVMFEGMLSENHWKGRIGEARKSLEIRLDRLAIMADPTGTTNEDVSAMQGPWKGYEPPQERDLELARQRQRDEMKRIQEPETADEESLYPEPDNEEQIR